VLFFSVRWQSYLYWHCVTLIGILHTFWHHWRCQKKTSEIWLLHAGLASALAPVYLGCQTLNATRGKLPPPHWQMLPSPFSFPSYKKLPPLVIGHLFDPTQPDASVHRPNLVRLTEKYKLQPRPDPIWPIITVRNWDSIHSEFVHLSGVRSSCRFKPISQLRFDYDTTMIWLRRKIGTFIFCSRQMEGGVRGAS